MKTFLVGLDNPGGLPGVCNSTNGVYNYLTDLEGLQKVPITNLTLPFYNAYTSFMGRAPDIYDANYYTGTLMFAHAVEKAQSLDTSVVAQTIHDGNWLGVQGIITFNANNFVPVPTITINPSTFQVTVGPGFAMLFSQWQPKGTNGCQQTIVWPPQYAQDATVYPPWWQPPSS